MVDNPDNNTNNKAPDEITSGTKKQEQAPRKMPSARPVFFLIAILFIIVGCLYFKQLIDNQQQQLLEFQQQSDVMVKDIRQQAGSLNNRVSQLAKQQDQLRQAINQIYNERPEVNEDWALAEVEYLLIIASHRLSLMSDVATALTAMEAAALRLQAISNPAIVSVREALITDINNLRAVNTVDITGLAIYLADLIDKSATLPLARSETTTGNVNDNRDNDPGASDTGWKKAFADVWQEIKSLVIIKKSGETRRALLLPDQEYFLVQNLRLELVNARLSVLRKDTDGLQASINLILDWLDKYFETSDASVANIIESLEQMNSLELQPEIPDINSSLETVRAYIRNNEK